MEIVGQTSHDCQLASRVDTIKTKLLEMSGQVSQVLEACNANSKVMDKLNAIVEKLHATIVNMPKGSCANYFSIFCKRTWY
jgi:hypothetical protein